MKRVSYKQIDYEQNELGPKTHIAGVVGLNKFKSPSIWILFIAPTLLNFYSTT